MIVRHAEKSDSKKIWKVRSEAIKGISTEYYNRSLINAWYNNDIPDDFEDVVVNFDWLVAELNNEIVGTGFLDPSKAEIGAIFVLPKFQRRKIGFKILKELEKIAKKRKLQTLYLDATLSAVEFYLAAGYEKIGKSECQLGKITLKSYKMKKDVKGV